MGLRPPHHLSALTRLRICLEPPPTGLDQVFHHLAGLPSCVPPSVITLARWHGIINPFPISYASRPHLRDRLTLGRRALPRKPWAYGERDSHPFYRYSCQHHLLWHLHAASRPRFIGLHNAPLPSSPTKATPAASVGCLAPLNLRRRHTRPVSCYAFFKGWLLLSQPPGCLSMPTSFPTQHPFRDLS